MRRQRQRLRRPLAPSIGQQVETVESMESKAARPPSFWRNRSKAEFRAGRATRFRSPALRRRIATRASGSTRCSGGRASSSSNFVTVRERSAWISAGSRGSSIPRRHVAREAARRCGAESGRRCYRALRSRSHIIFVHTAHPARLRAGIFPSARGCQDERQPRLPDGLDAVLCVGNSYNAGGDEN